MAKTKIVETEIKTLVLKQTPEQRKEIRNALKTVVENAKSPEKEIIKTEHEIFKDAIVPDKETLIDSEIKTEPIEIDNVKIDKIDETIIKANEVIDTVEPIKKKLSLFSSFKKTTEEDLNKNQVEQTVESLYDAATKPLEVNENEDSPEYQKTMSEALAVGIVEAAELALAFTCLIISGNWDRGFDYYKISKDKKKAIIICIIKIRLAQKKKTSPTSGLWILLGTAVAPMLIMAAMERISRNKTEKKIALENAKNNLALHSNQAQNPVYSYVQPTQNITPVINSFEQKKETRGRHKLTCKSLSKKGGACDCKG